jgi:hypothetical protein
MKVPRASRGSVSQSAGSPLARPRLNHSVRCSELPCVNVSGVHLAARCAGLVVPGPPRRCSVGMGRRVLDDRGPERHLLQPGRAHRKPRRQADRVEGGGRVPAQRALPGHRHELPRAVDHGRLELRSRLHAARRLRPPLRSPQTATVHVVEPGSGSSPPADPPPGSGSPGATTPAQDLVAPELTLGGARLHRVIRQRAVLVRVRTDEAATLTATGTVSVPATARAVRLRKATATSSAGQSVTLRLRLSRKALAAVRRGLQVRSRLRASVRVTATDAAGNRRSELRRIALRR